MTRLSNFIKHLVCAPALKLLRAGSLKPTPSVFIHYPPFAPLSQQHFHNSPNEKEDARATLSIKEEKKFHGLPGMVLLCKLRDCVKKKNLVGALELYDDAKLNNIPLYFDHYNSLLYVCSLGLQGFVELGVKRGFEIYQEMLLHNFVPNESTFTIVARLAALKQDPEMAYDLVKQMIGYGLSPKLRSYAPALVGFCNMKMADKAYEVYAHMATSGVLAEEDEIRALLKVSVDVKNADKVYEMLHQLRVTARQVAEETAAVVEEWFNSTSAAKVGEENWNVAKIKEALVKGGGGWHGQGWLGKGKWNVVRTEMDESGVCRSCKEKLNSVEIDLRDAQRFSTLVTNMACKREANNFLQFQDWLKRHGPFDAVVDGANIGFKNEGNFDFSRINNVVNQLRDISPSKKLPLVILHKCRVVDGPALDPRNVKLLVNWNKSGALYVTPWDSNEDWYWLYAAVSCRCLLVTRDELKKSMFQVLGTTFFPRWKEKHLVQVTVSHQGLKLHMPPPYSIVIQESEQGSWHVPTVTGDDLDVPRQWLCVTRTGEPESSGKDIQSN